MTTLRYSTYHQKTNETFKNRKREGAQSSPAKQEQQEQQDPPNPPARSKKVEQFLNAMENEGDLADFRPVEDEVRHAPASSSELPNNQTNEEYYKQYIPYFTDTVGEDDYTHSAKDELMEKLNYTIHLLEQQKDEKTDNVTEELVLYLFLGVFVIFVTDSFGRACKYIR